MEKIVSGEHNGKIKFWDARAGKELKISTLWYTEQLHIADGRLFAASGDSKTLYGLSADEQEVKTMVFGQCRESCLSPDGKKTAAGFRDRQIRVWETETWRELAIIKGTQSSQALTFMSMTEIGQR